MSWFESFRKNIAGGPSEAEAMNNFTPRAVQVLALARKEADRFNHNFVGTEHVLLGLIKLGNGVAFNVLQKLGLDLETLRAEVEKQVGTGPDRKLPGNVPYTPRVKKVLALAQKEAKALHHTYVGTEHILLGLLREGDGVPARVLKNLGVDIGQTRREILRELDPNFADNQQGQPLSPKIHPAAAPKTEVLPLDTSRRYDVFCSGEDQGPTVYRNISFKGCARLFSLNDYDMLSEFLELVEENGTTVFISRYWMVKFHEHEPADAHQTADKKPPSMPEPATVDITKRYDVSCTERSGKKVIYRAARFKARRSLLATRGSSPAGDFLEMEQEDGRTVFVSRAFVLNFRERGGARAEPPANPP